MTEGSLGEQIEQERHKRHWSQEKLAEALQVSRIEVSRWIAGVAVPNYYSRQRLIEVLGLEPELFGPLKRTRSVRPQKEASDDILVAQPVLLFPQVEDLLRQFGSFDSEAYVEVRIPPNAIYRGWRPRVRGRVTTTRVTVNDRPLPYYSYSGQVRFPERNTVYEWGYGGGGPRQLTESLLADYFRSRWDGVPSPRELYEKIWSCSNAFKDKFVCRFPDTWELSAEHIAAWLMDRERSKVE